MHKQNFTGRNIVITIEFKFSTTFYSSKGNKVIKNVPQNYYQKSKRVHTS
jgi:hypothetical protein